MNPKEKVKRFAELYEAINYYYEYRDQPVEEGFDLFSVIEKCCRDLDLDIEELKKEFKVWPNFSSE